MNENVKEFCGIVGFKHVDGTTQVEYARYTQQEDGKKHVRVVAKTVLTGELSGQELLSAFKAWALPEESSIEVVDATDEKETLLADIEVAPETDVSNTEVSTPVVDATDESSAGTVN